METDGDATLRLEREPGPQGAGPPRRLGRYIIEEVIARGGMGVVYRARQEDLGRTVALKVMLEGADAAPEDRERFAHEARSVARLSHPGIVQVYEVGEDGGRPWYAMELIAGQPLSAILQLERITLERALRLMEQVCAAIAHAHTAGIVHRDLKPANILVRPGDVPVVTDFGLARDLGSKVQLTATGTAMGTPAYMAPEQARGDRRAIGPATDVYALGAVVYELLTLQPPFEGPTPGVIISKVLNDDPPPLRKLAPSQPREAEWICQRAMAKAPAERYADAAELGEDLRRLREGHPIQARAPSLLGRSSKWVRRNRAVFALSVALLSLALGSLGFYLWDAERRERARRSAYQQAIAQASAAGAEEPERAIEAANIALAHFPDDAAALRLRGLAYSRVERFESAAIADLQALSRQGGAGAAERLLLAQLLIGQRHYDQVLDVLKDSALERAAPARLLEAEARWELGEVGKAGELLAACSPNLTTPPQQAAVALLRARMAEREGRRAEALARARRASDLLDPDSGGFAPREREDQALALKAHLHAARLARLSWQDPDGQGREALLAQQQHSARALALKAHDLEALFLNAEAVGELDGERRARPLWARLRVLHPQDPRPWYQLARFHLIEALAGFRDDELAEASLGRVLAEAQGTRAELRARAPQHPALAALDYMAARLAGDAAAQPPAPAEPQGEVRARLARYRHDLLALVAQHLPAAHRSQTGTEAFQAAQVPIRDSLLRGLIAAPDDAELWQSAYFTLVRLPQTPDRGAPFAHLAIDLLRAPGDLTAEAERIKALFPRVGEREEPWVQALFSQEELAEIAMLSGYALRGGAGTRYQAVGFFRRAAWLDPAVTTYAYRECLVLHFAEFNPDALEDVAVLLKHDPVNFEQVLERISNYREEVGDVYRAVVGQQRALLEEKLRRRPGGEVLIRGLDVFLAFMEGRYGEVLERLSAFADMVGRDSPLPATIQAFALLELDRPEEAQAVLERVLAADRVPGTAWALKAAVLGKLGRWDEVPEAFERAIAGEFQAERLFKHDPIFAVLREHDPFRERFAIDRIRDLARKLVDERTESFWRARLAR